MATLDAAMRKQNLKRAGKPVENMYDPPGDEPDGPGPDEVEGDYTQSPVASKPKANVAVDNAIGSTTKMGDKQADISRRALQPTPKKASKSQAPAAPAAPAVDPMASLRADLLANKRADDAARAAAEKKRMEAEDFSKKLKSATKKSGPSAGGGYSAYKSLMGE